MWFTNKKSENTEIDVSNVVTKKVKDVVVKFTFNIGKEDHGVVTSKFEGFVFYSEWDLYYKTQHGRVTLAEFIEKSLKSGCFIIENIQFPSSAYLYSEIIEETEREVVKKIK